MEQQEFEEDVDTCADCGASISPDADATFAFGDNRSLCFECAVRRRGEYDERDDTWTVAPDLTGLEPMESEP